MISERKRGLSRPGECAVIAVLLSAYAVAIVLPPDPEWIAWAGQMTVGVICPAALPPAMSAGAGETLHSASALSVLGILAAAVLVAAAGTRTEWLSRPAGHAVAGQACGGQGTGRHA